MEDYDPKQHWRIDDVVANGIIGSLPSYTIGKTTRIKFGFVPLQKESKSEYSDRIESIRDRARNAGAYAYHETMGGTAAYTETHNGDTLLAAIRSPESQTIDYGAWVLINEVDTTQRTSQYRDAYELKLDYLADFDEYQDKAAVEDALKTEGIF